MFYPASGARHSWTSNLGFGQGYVQSSLYFGAPRIMHLMDVGVYVETALTGGYWGAAAGRQSALPVRCVRDSIDRVSASERMT